MRMFPFPDDAPEDGHWDDPEPDPDSCQLGLSPLCTDEAAYLWNGQYCCAHCLCFVERMHEDGLEPSDEEQVRR